MFADERSLTEPLFSARAIAKDSHHLKSRTRHLDTKLARVGTRY